jgi:hypothetical protein
VQIVRVPGYRGFRGQRYASLRSAKWGHHHPEAAEIVAKVRMPGVAVSAAHVDLGIVERATTKHAAITGF